MTVSDIKGMQNDTSLYLRNVTLRDAAILRHWDDQQHVINSDPNDDWNWEFELRRQPAWREQFIAELGDTRIGFIQIIDPFEEESHYWGGVEKNLRAIDIWIGEKQNLGRGYGTIMMKLALEHCFENPEVTSVLIDPLESNTKAHKFYEKLGFRFIEKRSFGQDRCFVYRLDRKVWVLSIQ